MKRASGSLALIAVLLFAGTAALRAADAEPTTVVAVRHAEKASEGGRDPHLTPTGRARARALAEFLASAEVDGLYSSEFHRTRETLEPLAERHGLGIETIPARETNERLTAARLLAAHPGKVVVVAGHSNTIPSLIEALTGEPTPELDESVYEAIFVVTLHPGGGAHVLRLDYPALADPESADGRP